MAMMHRQSAVVVRNGALDIAMTNQPLIPREHRDRTATNEQCVAFYDRPADSLLEAVHVDLGTREGTVKDSAQWYQRVSRPREINDLRREELAW